MEEGRICTVCNIEKTYDCFSKSKKGKNGYAEQCKVCRLVKDREYYKKRPEICLAKHERWAKRNPEKILKNQREYYHRNKDKILEKLKETRKKNGYNTTKQYKHRNKEKIDAHNYVALAIKFGNLVRPETCEKCKKQCKPHAHHHDYTKPLDVIWVCPKCHGEEHRIILSA
jgi:hypothetical protein